MVSTPPRLTTVLLRLTGLRGLAPVPLGLRAGALPEEAAGRRVWGFMGVEAVARPHINGFYDVSSCTYVPEEWRD